MDVDGGLLHSSERSTVQITPSGIVTKKFREQKWFDREKIVSEEIAKNYKVKRHWQHSNYFNATTKTLYYNKLGNVKFGSSTHADFVKHARSYAWQLVSALATARVQLSLAHGDVKPANIMCKPREKEPVAQYYIRVIDNMVDVFEIERTDFELKLIDFESSSMMKRPSDKGEIEEMSVNPRLTTMEFNAVDIQDSNIDTYRFEQDIFAAGVTLISAACSGRLEIGNSVYSLEDAGKPPVVLNEKTASSDEEQLEFHRKNLTTIADYLRDKNMENRRDIDQNALQGIKDLVKDTFGDAGTRMIERMMRVDPRKRPTYQQLVQHRYFAPLLQIQKKEDPYIAKNLMFSYDDASKRTKEDA